MPLPETIIAGTVADTTFLVKAQTVDGALYNRNNSSIVGTMQVKVGKVSKKGIVKFSGNATLLIDGKAKKVSAKAVNVALDATGRVPPVTLAFKAPIGEMSLEMAADGTFTLKNGTHEMVEANVGGDWSKGGAKVYVDGALGDRALPAGAIEKLLPDGVPVIAAGGKWKFAKAASVKWAKPKNGAARPERYDAESGKGLVIDTSKGDNLSAMKLSYTPKKGTFKGSFKVYALEGAGKATKLKKYTVKVSGVVVDGVGHGVATSKNPAASWAVTVQ